MDIKSIKVSLLPMGLAMFALATNVYAQSCTTQYGGSVTCVPAQLTIIKEVQNPITNTFVANLGTGDASFSPDSEVLFRLKIKNTGSVTLSPVTVRDIFPPHLTFRAGPGTFDKGNNTLTFSIDSLAAGATDTEEILALVDSSNAFANDKSFLCELNTARATAQNMSSEATSQLCIQTNVLGVTTLPKAGVNDWIIVLPFLGVGLFGFGLLKKKIY